MGFTNLYSKSTANPKEIDFARIGTIVKNKIPEAAVKAFTARFPKALPKPFDFAFDTDRETGKLQITVKKAGPDFVFGWVDATVAENKAKMKVVETEIAGWKGRIEAAEQGVAKYQGRMGEIATAITGLEAKATSGQADAATMKEVDAAKAAIQKLRDEANALHAQMVQFWNAGPALGVLPLMKKHGLPAEAMGEERNQAFADHRALQPLMAKFQSDFTAAGSQVQALQKRLDDAGGKLFLQSNARMDRAEELETALVDIQKTVGEVQGYTNSDFAGVKAKEITKEAKEFAGKAGATWTKLSADPGEIDKAVARNREVFERMRILGGRVEERYQAWQRSPVGKKPAMVKYQEMLKMVRDEYMGELVALQNTLRGYSDALTKYKPKAVALAEKAAKATAKADAKAAKKK